MMYTVCYHLSLSYTFYIYIYNIFISAWNLSGKIHKTVNNGCLRGGEQDNSWPGEGEILCIPYGHPSRWLFSCSLFIPCSTRPCFTHMTIHSS